jgi:autotransporter-associated beta strand protein
MTAASTRFSSSNCYKKSGETRRKGLTFTGKLINLATHFGSRFRRKLMKFNVLTGATLFVVAIFIGQFAQGANTENDYIGSGTGNVTTTTNWSSGHVPTVTEDAVFNSSSNAGIKNYGGGGTVGSPVTVGSLDLTATTGTYSIRNDTTGATNAILNLGGAGNLGNGVTGTVASDLLFAASGSTLQLLGTNGGGGSGVLNVVLGQSGSFDAVGTIVVSSIISDGGNNFAVTKTGAGLLTLSGANTYGGGTTLSAGTLRINNGGTSATNSALGTGTFAINGGTITNTSGSDVTMATNNAQTWGGDFIFAGGSGTKNLNLGTGPVTLTGSRSINVSGTTSTLTVGGNIGDGGNGFSLTKSGPGVGTLILAGATNTYSGGTFLSSGTLVANGKLGTGNISLTAGNVTLTLAGATNNFIDDSATLSYVTTDTINLNFSGIDTVFGLTVDGVSQAPGLYGASASNPDGAFTGVGFVQVVVPEPGTWLLLCLGAGLLGTAQRFRRKRI